MASYWHDDWLWRLMHRAGRQWLSQAGIGLILLSLLACSSLSSVAGRQQPDAVQREHVLWVVNHGWHTGLVIPSAWLNTRLPELGLRFAEASFYEIGWGEAEFYQARQLGPGLILRALFASKASVLHLVGLDSSGVVQLSGAERHKLCLTPSQQQKLLDFLVAHFAQTSEARLIPLQPGLYLDSQFYQAKGRYHLFHTCNSWTAEALSAAGIELGASWRYIRAGSLMAALPQSLFKGCCASALRC